MNRMAVQHTNIHHCFDRVFNLDFILAFESLLKVFFFFFFTVFATEIVFV